MATLIISEKNKAAQAIAEALGPTKKIQVNKLVKVYHIPSQDIYVLPLRGHIQQYENTPAYKKWTAKDPRQIITDPGAIAKIPNNYAGAYISALKKYGKICSTCVVGTDADVEGCNIGLLDAVPFVTNANPKVQLLQLWLNDLQKKTIRQAYQKLITPKWSWAYSGEARAQIDAIIGFSATREVSLTLKPILQQINVKFTSIGRVQTSLLYLIYLREDLIRNFKPTQFWTISAFINLKGAKLKVNHVKNNFTQKAVAEQIYNQIKSEKTAILDSAQAKTKKIKPPVPLNTSKALQLITKTLKINAKTALKTLEDLYLNKLITYPRTDSDVYSPEFDHVSILKQFLTHSQFGPYTRDLFSQKRIFPTKGRHNTGDHSPITPLVSLEPSAKKFENKLQERVYQIIARYYLALFGEDAEESETRMLFDIKGEKFMGQVKVLTKQGFYAIAPFLAPNYTASLPKLPTVGKGTGAQKPVLPVDKIVMEEKETQPPPRYNDTSLLQLMERKNLGTKSTRPAIIQILLDRMYILRKGRAIYLTDLGYLLIGSLLAIWKPFLDPSFTARVEAKLQAVIDQKIAFKQAVDGIKAEFLLLFDLFRQEKPNFLAKMGSLQTTGNVIRGRNNVIVKSSLPTTGSPKGGPGSAATIANGSSAPLTQALCPKCKKSPMKLIISPKTKKKFLVCADDQCKTYLSLPNKGTPRLLKNQCSLCNFDIVKVTTSKRGHKFHYFLCPLCWTHGLKNQLELGFCSKCKSYHIVKGKCVKK